MSSQTTRHRRRAKMRRMIVPASLVLLAGGACNVDEPPTARRETLDRASATRAEPRPIVVDAPSIGQRVSNPMTVSGSANVFEATVSMRLLDANGNVIADKFTTATCGSGCRGDYSTRVRFLVDAEQGGTLEVFESSAKDGRPLHTVSLPVVLVP